VKNHQLTISSITYIYHESQCLALCPVLAFVSRAFADGAFEAPNLTPQTFYEITSCTEGLHQNHFTIKEEMRNVPLFHKDLGKPYSYDFIAKCVRKLGQATGLTQVLTQYAVRRMVGNAIENVPVAQRTLAMAQRDAGEYERSYQSGVLKIDLQSLVIGEPSKDKLIKACHNMRRFLDPRFPWQPPADKVAEAQASSRELQDLEQDASDKRGALIRQFGQLKLGIGTELHASWQKAKNSVRAARYKIKNQVILEEQEAFKKSAPVDDIERLIHGLPSTVPQPSGEAVHRETQRARVAELLFDRNEHTPALLSPEDVARRVAAVEALVIFSRAKPIHWRQKLNFSLVEDSDDDSDESEESSDGDRHGQSLDTSGNGRPPVLSTAPEIIDLSMQDDCVVVSSPSTSWGSDDSTLWDEVDGSGRNSNQYSSEGSVSPVLSTCTPIESYEIVPENTLTLPVRSSVAKET